LVAGKTLTKTVPLTEQNAASNQTAKVAPVADILTWIGSHFDTITQVERDDWNSKTGTVTYSMSFQGCSATLISNFTLSYTHINSADNLRGHIDSTQDEWTFGPFDLSKLRPDKIEAGSAPLPSLVFKAEGGAPSPQLAFLAVNAIPYKYVHDGRNWPLDPGQASSGVTQVVPIHFATQDIANSQAKAWRDAIIACGGKAVSDKLY
jgi:hypothetical protein